MSEANLEGANLWKAHLCNTNFQKANMEGAFSDPSRKTIQSRIGMDSDLSNVIITEQNEENITNIFENAITGILTQEKADEIIERYKKAMANVPNRKLFLSVEMN